MFCLPQVVQVKNNQWDQRMEIGIREFRAKGNPLTFPLTFPSVLREKLREFPSQILFGLREISQTETTFPLGRFAREWQAYTEK